MGMNVPKLAPPPLRARWRSLFSVAFVLIILPSETKTCMMILIRNYCCWGQLGRSNLEILHAIYRKTMKIWNGAQSTFVPKSISNPRIEKAAEYLIIPAPQKQPHRSLPLKPGYTSPNQFPAPIDATFPASLKVRDRKLPGSRTIPSFPIRL